MLDDIDARGGITEYPVGIGVLSHTQNRIRILLFEPASAPQS